MSEDKKVKHTSITTIYNDNQNGKYLQKLLKSQAGWLWCSNQVV
jgi:hypothetical protein